MTNQTSSTNNINFNLNTNLTRTSEQTMNTKKTFHMIYEDGTRRLRVAFHPEVHVKYNPDTMFHTTHETSEFLDMFLPMGDTYGQISTFGNDERSLMDAVNEFEQTGKRGFYSKSLPVNETHRVLYGAWEDHGTSIVVPKSASVRKLEDIGVHLTMASKSDTLKVRKYFRRVVAHHEWAVSGTVTGSHAVPAGNVLSIRAAGSEFKVLHVDISQFDERNKAMVDGIHLISIGLLRSLAAATEDDRLAKLRIGDAFKGTMFSKLGLGKGFFHVVDMEHFGIIIYGPKKQVRFDKFFLGSLGDVKGGRARTCMQSLGAFITNESSQLWINQATLHINEVTEAIRNEDKLRSLFLTHIAPMSELIENRDTEGWVLVEALRHGVPILHNPGLFRRVVRHLLTTVLDCEKGRIPYGPVAYRYNLMPDLSVIDFETGVVDHTKSVIPDDAVCCMDAPQGAFAIYRQPLGNAKEAVVTTNIHNRRFKKFMGRERVILGAGALEMLKTMGGADFDDSVIGTADLDWVEVIAKAEYPVTLLPEAEETEEGNKDDDNIFLNGGTVQFNGQTIHIHGSRVRTRFPRNWSMVDYFDAATKATERTLSIGPLDNAGRLDLMLSGPHKVSMLRNIAARIEKTTDSNEKIKLQKAFTWLYNRADHILRMLMSNLETAIDLVKMGKGDQATIDQMMAAVNDVSQNSLVYPECWAWLGKGGRIPYARKEANDYVLAPSLVCNTLNTIRGLRDDLVDALKEDEWSGVQRIPTIMNELFPRTDDTREDAFELRSLWREWWMPVIAGESFRERDGRKKANKLILDGGDMRLRNGDILKVEGVRKMFNMHAAEPGEDVINDRRLDLAVEIARQTYRSRHEEAEKDDQGKRRSFSDGLLWTNVVGLWYIEALKLAGLTGLFIPVEFDRYSRQFRAGEIKVKVLANTVHKLVDNFMIGFVAGNESVPDGEYDMRDGLLVVQEPSPELTEAVTDIDEGYNNPLIDDEMVALA